MKPILEVHNISKKFLIDHEGVAYLSMRDKLASAFKSKPQQEEFWALKDVSFDVMPGESIGIIGRNGAGKSTLLKILSRITPPTEGSIKIRGRIASLLEVGTGFHQELTGRENIFMNGSILGMKRAEIKNRFDEIVDFSGVEKFLDTPLKNYSSGMQLRLAFAVAAHLDPEILIIDEVLAVGDAEFQKKCMGKMEDVTRGGRTILFVSHNMQAISKLCARGIYLKDGTLEGNNPMGKLIDQYLTENVPANSFSDFKLSEKIIKSDPDFKLDNIVFYQDDKEVFGNVVNGKEIQIEVHYELNITLNRFRVFLDVCDHLGTIIFRSFHDENNFDKLNLNSGSYKSKVAIPANLLGPHSYDFKFYFGVHNVRMMEPVEGISFRIHVEQTGHYNKAYGGQYTAGLLCPSLSWEVNQTNKS